MSNKYDKPVTVKFTNGDYLGLADEAERSGTSIAQIVRESCLHYRQLCAVQEQLAQMEQRQQIALFEMLSATLELNSEKKLRVLALLAEKGVNI
jgi:hypothetical protein